MIRAAASITACALLLAMPSAQAAVYKCRGADGVPVYQQVPCAVEQEQVMKRKVSADERGVRPVRSAAIALGPEQAERALEGQIAVETLESLVAPPSGEARVTIYRCDDGINPWLQPDPCPATVAKYLPPAESDEPATQDSVAPGRTGRGRVERDPACVALDVASQSESGADTESSYQRNRQRDALGC